MSVKAALALPSTCHIIPVTETIDQVMLEPLLMSIFHLTRTVTASTLLSLSCTYLHNKHTITWDGKLRWKITLQLS